MTAGLTRSALLLMLVLMATGVAGCGHRAPAAPEPRSALSTSTSALPQPALTELAHTDPAVWAAVEFELEHCAWNWQIPMATYIGAQQVFASPEYGQQIAAEADPASWQQEVIQEREVVTCTVTGPARVQNAPSTATQVYVRMTANSHITSTLGSFDSGLATASWVVQLAGGHWRVTGPFEGG
ncbi:hypothetical protein SAMN05892883_2248 [Jatrophihabitans sp. GAS493]|uniref:hypothetical protein n=1 Tax=Jatrophihabitans sp. GAS493 TaxID=1907575 RepID=UPI000BB6ED92|nr:hypothetical protein [Jatrophihabitans sp. GAS493]SOD72935.1 hypothetical protein SAMN05892883_2248 [Jatrophihabitans sp. GAS493]